MAEPPPKQSPPKGPLAVRYLGFSLDPVRAGVVGRAEVELENAGTVVWRSNGAEGVQVAYHWLDERGNPIVWDGARSALPHPVEPGGRVRVEARVQGAIPPGRYRFALDLILEGRAWFAEVGNAPVERVVDVLPRIERRLAVVGADPGALDAQEEPPVAPEDAAAVAYLAPGVVPAPDWSRRVLDAHQEGFALVGGSVAIEAGPLASMRLRSELAPWKPGGGRVPGFAHPLLCPSIVSDVEPAWGDPVCGLPAARAREGDPLLYDGRIAVTARPRSGRRRA
jgi:hypothetical protein